jgi:hypothetical protein
LSIHDHVGHGGVGAWHRHAEIIRPAGAEVREGQIIEVEPALPIHGQLGIASAMTGRHLPDQRRCVRNPFERLARIEGTPDPARVRGECAGRAGIDAVRVGWIDANGLLKSGSSDAADDRVAKRRCVRAK